MDWRKLQCLTALADSERRIEAAARVADLYGCDSIILFIKDEAIGLSLPVSGFPQTLPGGQRWQGFLKRCVETGSAQDMLLLPDSPEPQQTTGIACKSGAVLVFVGGTLREEAYTEIPLILPVLHLALKGEQTARVAEANAQLAAERVSIANRLAESLDKARLDLANILVESRATQRELMLADRRKNEFLALLAHELRNPLAPIGNAIELLRIGADKPAVITKVWEIMHTQFKQMVRLIDDLMDVSRISTGKIVLKKEVLDLSTVLLNATEAARPQMEARKHKLIISALGDYTVLADPVRLNQVFLNILTNAATYTPPGGTVTVSVAESSGHVNVNISDTGKGVPTENASKIFIMFAQGDDTISRTSGGLGIGLGLAKSLVELHDGTITVSSEGRNRGSCFTVRLPLYVEQQQAGEIRNRAMAADSEVAFKILVADDNEDSAKTMGWTLAAMGHDFQLAFDGPTALQVAQTYGPQIILLDIGMPGMSGYEVCAAIRANPRLRNALLVAQTGWGMPDDKQKAKHAGFDHHLVKPVNIDDLKKIIEQFGAAGRAAATATRD